MSNRKYDIRERGPPAKCARIVSTTLKIFYCLFDHPISNSFDNIVIPNLLYKEATFVSLVYVVGCKKWYIR